MNGSPPRVRGEAALRGLRPGPADHPRVCGEKYEFRLKNRNWFGSPPRVRGEVPLRFADRGFLGITPACAGRSPKRVLICREKRDHPRVCGEKRRSKRRPRQFPGSPPRVRGEGVSAHHVVRDQRITPACAGRRRSFADMATRMEDHPRVCGEKPRWSTASPRGRGSPPRVRGEVAKALRVQPEWRITPACAGRRQFK